MKNHITGGANANELIELALNNGMKTLWDNAWHKINQGLTTVDEVLRVLGPQVIE